MEWPTGNRQLNGAKSSMLPVKWTPASARADEKPLRSLDGIVRAGHGEHVARLQLLFAGRHQHRLSFATNRQNGGPGETAKLDVGERFSDDGARGRYLDRHRRTEAGK